MRRPFEPCPRDGSPDICTWPECGCVPPTDAPSDEIEAVARAMKAFVRQPLGNLRSLEPVLTGSLGDAWNCIARAAISALDQFRAQARREEAPEARARIAELEKALTAIRPKCCDSKCDRLRFDKDDTCRLTDYIDAVLAGKKDGAG
jgi:hypothetical protein